MKQSEINIWRNGLNESEDEAILLNNLIEFVDKLAIWMILSTHITKFV